MRLTSLTRRRGKYRAVIHESWGDLQLSKTTRKVDLIGAAQGTALDHDFLPKTDTEVSLSAVRKRHLNEIYTAKRFKDAAPPDIWMGSDIEAVILPSLKRKRLD